MKLDRCPIIQLLLGIITEEK